MHVLEEKSTRQTLLKKIHEKEGMCLLYIKALLPKGVSRPLCERGFFHGFFAANEKIYQTVLNVFQERELTVLDTKDCKPLRPMRDSETLSQTLIDTQKHYFLHHFLPDLPAPVGMKA